MRRILITFAAITLLMAPHITCASDLDDLKVAHEKLIQAWNAHDLDAIMTTRHGQAIGYYQDNPVPSDVSLADYRLMLQDLFANTEQMVITPINPQYRVIGNVGIAWYLQRQVRKPKDGPTETLFTRITLTFAKVDGNYVLACFHVSKVPTGS